MGIYIFYNEGKNVLMNTSEKNKNSIYEEIEIFNILIKILNILKEWLVAK